LLLGGCPETSLGGGEGRSCLVDVLEAYRGRGISQMLGQLGVFLGHQGSGPFESARHDTTLDIRKLVDVGLNVVRGIRGQAEVARLFRR
jgi:hypothetical protein